MCPRVASLQLHAIVQIIENLRPCEYARQVAVRHHRKLVQIRLMISSADLSDVSGCTV